MFRPLTTAAEFLKSTPKFLLLQLDADTAGDDSVIFIKGWFKDTIPNNTIEKISVLRLDGDMYESTIDVLDYLYPKLSVGGFCIIDDFAHKGANAAVMDYRRDHLIDDEIFVIDSTKGSYPSSYWIKSK